MSRQVVAERTIAFRFEKPSGWAFHAGQFLDMTLLAPAETDAEGRHTILFDRQRASRGNLDGGYARAR